MALAVKYVQEGNILNYANASGSTISYREIIAISGQTSRIYVAAEEILNGATGGVYAEGVFEIAAVNDTAFAFGEHLYWDSVASKLTKTSTGDGKFYAGRCVKAKAQTGTATEVKLGDMGDVDGPST
jgi:predicted RecA/RadA family phage recombinase